MQPSCLPLESPCLFMENSPKDSIDHQQDLRVERQKDVSDIKKHALAEDAENSFCNVSSNDCLNDCVQNCEGTDSQCNVFSIDRTSVLQNSCLPQVSNKTYEKSTVNDCQISDTQDLDKANAKACWIGNKSGTLTDMSYSNPKKCFQEKFCFDELKTLGLFLAHIYALYQHTVCSKNCKSSLQNSVAWLGILDHYEDELLDFVSMCNERRDELNHVFLCKSSETEKDTGNELLKQENDFKTFEKGQNQDVLAHTFFVHSGVQDDKFLHCVAEWYQIKCHKGLFCNKTLKKEQEIKAPPLNNLTHTLVCDVQEKPQSSATPKILKYKNEKTCESVSGSYQITKLFFECLQALKELKDIFGGARHIQSDIDLSSYYLRSAISAYQKHDLRKDTDEEKTALRNMYKANCLHEGELDSLLYSDSTCTGISHRMCETGRCEKASCFYDAALSTPRMQSIRNVLKNKTLDNRVHDDGEQEKGTYETAQAGVSQEISIQGQLGKENIVEKEFYPPSEHSNMVATQNIPFNSLPDQLCYEKASLLDTKKNTAVNHQQECLLILGFLKRASPQWAAHYHSHEWHSRYISVERNESIEMYMKIFLPQESFFALNTMSCHKNNLILSSSFILPMKNAFELLCLWFNRLDCFRLSHEPNFEPFFLIPSVEQKNYSQPFLSLSSDILNHVNFFLNDSAPKWKKYLDLRESQVVFSCNKRHNSTTPGVSTSPCREPSFFTQSQYTAQTSNGASTRKELDDISAVKNSMLMYPSLHDPPLVSFQKYETVSTCATPARLSMVSLNSACHNPQENVFMPFTPNLGKVTSQILSPVKITHKRKRRMVVMICTARPCSLPPSNETEDVKSLLSPSCKKLCLVTKPYHESSVPNFTQRICEKTSHTTFYNSFMYQPNNITFHDAKKNELNPYLASAFVSPTASLRFKNKKIPTQKQLHNEDKVTRLPICKKKKLSSKQQEDVSLEVQKLQATSTSDVFSSYPAYSEATKSSSPPTHDLRVMWNPQENAWVVAVAKEFSSLGYPIFCSFPVSRYGADMARYLAFQWKDQHDSSVLEERIVQHPSIITTHQICDQTSSTPPCQNTDEKKSSPPSPSNHTLPSKNTTQQRSTSRSSKYTTGNTRATTTCHSRNPPKSEIPGVYWYRNRNGWVAQWFEKGKNKHKFFAASAFGIEGAKEKAIAYRLMKLEEKRLKGW
ncbi:uncharacterized protein LOC128883422 isoform X3 [Hylaeus volcanicus]|uniref:uncharacterized protein LOC128883422 isoform X3 n=1 Tax=Hylaeus volcanicus TaxID=313075 RepID=UPI0023B88204|nr:uncharacterized protein LOC128883422 isoform X3 [Hylaeus volcanicus]